MKSNKSRVQLQELSLGQNKAPSIFPVAFQADLLFIAAGQIRQGSKISNFDHIRCLTCLAFASLQLDFMGPRFKGPPLKFMTQQSSSRINRSKTGLA